MHLPKNCTLRGRGQGHVAHRKVKGQGLKSAELVWPRIVCLLEAGLETAMLQCRGRLLAVPCTAVLLVYCLF